jgi:hypothetical protein
MPSTTQYSRIFICPLFCKPMIYPSHSSGSLVLQAKYRRNCILNPIALSTDQLCYFKPTVSSSWLVLFYTRLGDGVGFRFRPLVHFIQKVPRHFLRLFLSITSSEVAFLSNWITTQTTKIRNTLALLFVPSHFLKIHDFAS